MAAICSDWLLHEPGETLDRALRYTAGVGAGLLRLHLTPVLEGARAQSGAPLADAARSCSRSAEQAPRPRPPPEAWHWRSRITRT